MEPSPFNRRQWTSQSLKITAKELSLVNKNKSSALMERFSKYQKAAEEATAEKRRSISICVPGNRHQPVIGVDVAVTVDFWNIQTPETLPPHFKRGNLSVLKKKWENPVLETGARKETQRSSCAEVGYKAGSSASSQDTEQNPEASVPTGTSVQPQCAGRDSGKVRSCSPESGDMENGPREPREVEKPEAGENTDSSAKIEKYNVPLNKLKMMFERGEATPSKVPREQRKVAGSWRISENSLSSEDLDVGQGEKSHGTAGHLVDTNPALSPEKTETKKSLEMPRLTETSIKDRLAKYQAAVSKHGSSPGLTIMTAMKLRKLYITCMLRMEQKMQLQKIIEAPRGKISVYFDLSPFFSPSSQVQESLSSLKEQWQM